MSQEIIKQIQELFFQRLDEKTGWGKEQIKELYKQCVIDVITKLI